MKADKPENKGNSRYWLKSIYIAVILLAIWWCFRSYWESLVERWFSPLLSAFTCDEITTIGFFLLLGLTIGGTFYCGKKGFCIGTRWRGIAIAVLIMWLIYRFVLGDNTIFVFYPVEGCGRLYYVDLIAVLCCCCIASRLIKPKKMQNEDEEKGFIKDEPIKERDEDILKRRDLAKGLVEKLINTKVDNEAFTLGITASWGDGKTSFMKLMKEVLLKDYKGQFIIMDFNPWLYGKEVNLLHIFFDELRRKIAPRNRELSKDLRHYADALSKVDTSWSQVAAVLKVGFPSKNINEQWKDISEQIKRIQKKIVIFIDDIDRLEGTEMAEVFQLVRNASNFPHMYFVVGYDKKYVVDTLQGVYGVHKLLYTEKILQEEYALPRMTEQDIFDALKGLFEKVLCEKDLAQLQVSSWASLREINICNYFKNLRDIKRFGNILIGYYARLKDEVDINDFVRYLILHLRYPLVQGFIEEHRDSVLRQKKDNYGYGKKIELYHNPTNEKESAVEIFDRQDHFDLIKCLQQDKYKEEWHLDVMDVPLVIQLLEALWGSNRILATRGINNSQYIHRYFLKNLMEHEISKKEMEEFLRLDFQSMKPKIQEWVESKSASLVTQLSLVPKDKETVKKYLQIIFYANEIGRKNRFHSWDIYPMIKFLYNVQTGTYNEEDKLFIRELLLREENPRYSVSYITSVEEDMEDWFPLDKEELKEIKNTIFQKYAKDPHNGIEAVCDMWYDTRILERMGNGRSINHYDERCNQTMRDIAEADFENFIPLSIHREGGSNQLFSLSLPAIALWKDKEGYFDYAESQKKDTPEWHKYSDFLHRLKANAWNAVPFDIDDKTDTVN